MSRSEGPYDRVARESLRAAEREKAKEATVGRCAVCGETVRLNSDGGLRAHANHVVLGKALSWLRRDA